jgi:hypothetical protein
MKTSGPGKIDFSTLLVTTSGGALVLPVPKNVSASLGSRGRVEVKGTLNGKPLRANALPDGKGGHNITIERQMLDVLGVRAGDRVKVALDLIAEQEIVEPPADFLKVLGQNVQAKPAWEKFPPSHRKAYIDWIEQAQKPEVRARRIQEAVQRIALGKQSWA